MVQVLEQVGGGSMVIVVRHVGSASSVRVRIFSPSEMGYGQIVGAVRSDTDRAPYMDIQPAEVLVPVTVNSKVYMAADGSVGLSLSWLRIFETLAEMVQVLEQVDGASMVIVVWHVGSSSLVRVRIFSPSEMGYG